MDLFADVILAFRQNPLHAAIICIGLSTLASAVVVCWGSWR